MARPNFSPVLLDSGTEGWDAEVDDNFAAAKEVFQDGPIPLKEYANVGALPAAAQYDRCACMVNLGGAVGWTIAISNGAAWQFVPKQAAAQANSTAAALADLVTDFNTLLTKLRATGVIAT